MKRTTIFKPGLELSEQAERKIKDTFGSNLKRIREGLDYSQETAANLIGVSRSYYADIEYGNRNVSIINIARILLAFQIEFNELLPLSELKKQSK